MIPALLIAIAAFLGLNALLTIGAIGKPRRPITPGMAITVLIVDTAIAAVLIAAAVQL